MVGEIVGQRQRNYWGSNLAAEVEEGAWQEQARLEAERGHRGSRRYRHILLPVFYTCSEFTGVIKDLREKNVHHEVYQQVLHLYACEC